MAFDFNVAGMIIPAEMVAPACRHIRHEFAIPGARVEQVQGSGPAALKLPQARPNSISAAIGFGTLTGVPYETSGQQGGHMTPVRIALAAAAVLATAAAAAALAPFEPGDWEVTTKAHFDFPPGTPPMVARMLAAQTAAPQVRHHCVTAADLAVSPGAVLAISGGTCHYRTATFADGHMALQTECNGANGEHTITDVVGTYTPTGFTATGTKTRDGQPGPVMTIITSGRWTGAACRAG